MTQLIINQSQTTEADLSSSRITDLLIVGNSIYGTQRFDGAIKSWDLETLTQSSQTDYLANPMAGATPTLSLVGNMILSAGWANQNLALHELQSNGTIGPSIALPSTMPLFQLNSQTNGSTTSVFGIPIGGKSVTHLSFDDAQQLETVKTASSEHEISHIALATLNETPYLFTASATNNSVTSWAFNTQDDHSPVSYLYNTDGFWTDTPTAINTATVDGETYLIVAGSGSSSLSVLHVSAGGALQAVDHILDDRDTRFANASTLEVVQHEDATFILAAGSDDGVSLFRLLPGGRLLHLSSIEDTDEITLANVSAIAANMDASGIDLIVTSSTEAGLTKLRFDIDENADLVIGTPNADTLFAGSGDDILADDAGSDILTGGAGNDIFVLSADSATDTITDFTLGQDRVDLSAWTGLRSASQLSFEETTDGLRISYGPELLILKSANGTSINSDAFIAGGLSITTRLSSTIVPGFSGPETILPTLPDRELYVAPVQTPALDETGIQRSGLSVADELFGTAFDDILWGQGGDDTLFGNQGADTLFGGSGSDTLSGGLGNDQLSGGSGRDQTWAFSSTTIETSDTLYGDDGDDDLFGFSGSDWLEGGAGDDVLTGGGGRDTFVFYEGSDRITDFTAYVDTILLDTNLWDGDLTARDVVDTFASRTSDQFTLSFGTDQLILEGDHTMSEIEARIEFFG